MGKLVKCKSCGAEIAKSANVCPQCGAKLKMPVWGAVLVVISVFIFIGVVGSIVSSDEPTKVGEDNPTPTGENQKQTTFGLNDKVELNDIVVTFNSVTNSTGSQFNKPSDGNVFVLCEFTIENNSENDIGVSSMISFEAYFDDFATNISLAALIEKGNKSQLDGTVAAGKKMNGVIGYEAPADYENIEIQFTPNFWTGKDITFVYSK